MLRLFAAVWYSNCAYTITIVTMHLYLQLMLELPKTHLGFINNSVLAVVIQFVGQMAALSTNLVIEQVMMRAVKSKEGLTHCRGLTDSDSIRLLWVRSTHVHAAVHSTLGKLINPMIQQNVDLSNSRKLHDCRDLTQLINQFERVGTKLQPAGCMTAGQHE